jgi:hypothetical protein
VLSGLDEVTVETIAAPRKLGLTYQAPAVRRRRLETLPGVTGIKTTLLAAGSGRSSAAHSFVGWGRPRRSVRSGRLRRVPDGSQANR